MSSNALRNDAPNTSTPEAASMLAWQLALPQHSHSTQQPTPVSCGFNCSLPQQQQAGTHNMAIYEIAQAGSRRQYELHDMATTAVGPGGFCSQRPNTGVQFASGSTLAGSNCQQQQQQRGYGHAAAAADQFLVWELQQAIQQDLQWDFANMQTSGTDSATVASDLGPLVLRDMSSITYQQQQRQQLTAGQDRQSGFFADYQAVADDAAAAAVRDPALHGLSWTHEPAAAAAAAAVPSCPGYPLFPPASDSAAAATAAAAAYERSFLNSLCSPAPSPKPPPAAAAAAVLSPVAAAAAAAATASGSSGGDSSSRGTPTLDSNLPTAAAAATSARGRGSSSSIDRLEVPAAVRKREANRLNQRRLRQDRQLEVQELKQQVSALSAQVQNLEASLRSQQTAHGQLLDRLADVTGKWRDSVSENARLTNENTTLRAQLVGLQPQQPQQQQQQRLPY